MTQLCERCERPIEYPDGVHLKDGTEIHKGCAKVGRTNPQTYPPTEDRPAVKLNVRGHLAVVV